MNFERLCSRWYSLNAERDCIMHAQCMQCAVRYLDDLVAVRHHGDEHVHENDDHEARVDAEHHHAHCVHVVARVRLIELLKRYNTIVHTHSHMCS